MGDRKFPKYISVDGFRLPGSFYPDAFRDTLKYKPIPDDVFLVTYPKCGTNWMHYIIYLILHEGEPPKTGADFFMQCPFPEMSGVETIAFMKRPGVIKTHLPFHLQPYSPEARYIFLTRNPKDCCLSFYHHTESSAWIYDFEDGDFNDYFELFMKGEVDYGDYFDHVLSWYEHRNDKNLLMLTYEELKADPHAAIKKTARFISEDYGTILENDKAMLDKIVENSNVKNMKAATEEFMKEMGSSEGNVASMTPAMKYMFAKMAEGEKYSKGGPGFRIVRKGIVGDWRNVFSSDQNRRMDQEIERRMAGTELLKYWKEIGAI